MNNNKNCSDQLALSPQKDQKHGEAEDGRKLEKFQSEEEKMSF